MRSPSCCATHPATATIGREPSSSARCFNSPSRVKSFSSARSRTLHVLMTTTSASRSSAVGSYPAWSRRPAMRSESWTFIWQPYVSMKYFRDMRPCRASLYALLPRGLSLSPFDLYSPFAPTCRAFSISAALARTAGVTTLPAIIRATSSSRSVAPSLVTEVSVRPWRTDLLMWKCVAAVRGDLGQVGNAEHLESIRQTLQPSSHHVRHCPADPGVDLVEDERLAGCVGRREGLQRQHDSR